ncbi:hypothetical protein BEL01nite_43350 [Bradyrhizobium elkanii]|nr:hypothetical protein BEL01nite_43350 [Bradyrhizobium elkanii]
MGQEQRPERRERSAFSRRHVDPETPADLSSTLGSQTRAVWYRALAYGPFSSTCRDNLTYKSYVDCVEIKWFLGEYRNRAWWLCSSLQVAGKFKVAELKRSKPPH